MAMIWSPSISAPSVIDGQHPVGIAVEGEPDVGPMVEHRLLEVVGVGGATAVVDVRAVGVGVDHRDLGAEAPQHMRGDRDRGAVGTVDDDLHSGKGATVDRLHDGVGIAEQVLGRRADRAQRVACRAEPAPSPACTRRSSSASSAASTSSRSLRPPVANSLMPLSGYRLCDAEIIAPATPSWAAVHATTGVGTTPIVCTDTLRRRALRRVPLRATAPRYACRDRSRSDRRSRRVQRPGRARRRAQE